MFNSIPSRYKSVVDNRILKSAFKESSYNCLDCNMVKEGYYKADLKCCTYFPFLPNFVVGEVLFSGGEGARLLTQKIENKKVLPLGLIPDPDYKTKYRNTSGLEYGQVAELACPFLGQAGGCQIWLYRNSMCSSFQCKSSYGDAGYKVWHQFNEFFGYVELNFAQMNMLEHGFDWTEVLDNLNWYENNHISEGHPFVEDSVYAMAWGAWFGRELEYFEKTWNWFSSLSKEKFWEESGCEGHKLYESLCKSISYAIASPCLKLNSGNKKLYPNSSR